MPTRTRTRVCVRRRVKRYARADRSAGAGQCVKWLTGPRPCAASADWEATFFFEAPFGDMRKHMCREACKGLCKDMCKDMGVEICMDTCVDTCTGMCADMCKIFSCRHACRYVYRHACCMHGSRPVHQEADGGVAPRAVSGLEANSHPAGSLYILMAYVVIAYVVMAYIIMVYIVIAHTVIADRVMAYIVMACIVMAYILIACIVMTYIFMAMCGTRSLLASSKQPRPPQLRLHAQPRA